MNEAIQTFFTVRHYHQADRDAVDKIERLCYPEMIGAERFDWDLFQFMHVVDRAAFGVVGFCAACPVLRRCGHPSRYKWQIACVGVHPEFQRFKFGSFLVRALADQVADITDGAGVLQCYAPEGRDGLGAALFLKSLGFVGVDTFQGYIRFLLNGKSVKNP